MALFHVRFAAVVLAALPLAAQSKAPVRPFGTARAQAALQQQWLEKRMTTILPVVMRKYGVDMWVVPMREYNEDPLFTSLVSPTTFAARRRTIYVFFDTGTAVERIALGGGPQGGVYTPVFATKTVGGRSAELWGDQQWTSLKEVIEKRDPKRIAIDKSRIPAFADGLSSGEFEGMSEALGPQWTTRFAPAEDMAVELIATRLPEEETFYAKLTAEVWSMIEEMFSSRTITPGVTRTSDLVWWWRQRLTDRGLGTWFHPSVSVQRKGATAEALDEDPII
ncbi:MAG: Xaa-Pro aminopeptidase, partial [Gemmatimonadota bacterium]